MGNPPAHRARKRFGQNFLHDPGIILRIIQAIGPKAGDNLVEIGPGQGAITLPLLEQAGRLQVVELDRDLIEPLSQQCSDKGELTIHNTDALKFDFATLVSEKQPLRVVGNLPYNISTPILFHLLDQSAHIRDMHFMLQKEVVDRMAAGPGSKTYGRLSVMLQARCQVDPLFSIGPGAFKPPPKVDSAFVRLTPYPEPPFPVDDWDKLNQLVTQAFSQRRKTLRNSLQKMLSAAQVESLGIDPGQRPEQLDLKAFIMLANLLAKQSR
jgi:16S rRNA (adenine1518-N6/adenine1519-N6)-dimethyltransferase